MALGSIIGPVLNRSVKPIIRLSGAVVIPSGPSFLSFVGDEGFIDVRYNGFLVVTGGNRSVELNLYDVEGGTLAETRRITGLAAGTYTIINPVNDESFTVTVLDVDMSLTETTTGELELDGATGVVTYTITAPTHYAGTYTSDVADLASGPDNLIPALIELITDADTSTGVSVGDTVGTDGNDADSHPGLWLYDDADGVPTVTYQWQRDGVDISGATSETYTVVAADASASLTRVDTYTNTAGSRSVASNALAVATASTATVVHSDDFSTDTSADYTATGVTIGGGSASVTDGTSNQELALNSPPTLTGDYYVEAELGTFGSTSENFRLRAVRDPNWGTTYNRVEFRLRGDGYLDVFNGSTNVHSVNAATHGLGFATGDVIRIEVDKTAQTATIFKNGVEIAPETTDLDISAMTMSDVTSVSIEELWTTTNYEIGTL